MADYKAPLRDMNFVLNEVFQAPLLWASLPALAETVDPDTASAILEEAAKVNAGIIAPLNREADEQGAQWSNGEVKTADGFIEAWQTYAEGGWVGVGGAPEYDGMGMPKMLTAQLEEMVNAANVSFGLFPMLTAGACLSLHAHASEELKQKYLPNMYSGQWAGSMCLTEPHAGTDLGIIRTKAEPQDDGSFRITGTKIFITGGEHDLTENIIHLVLAKLPDAPAGARGISLFLVPKFMVNEDGSLGERNAVSCGSIEHKMGIKASPTCVMNFDNAIGYIVDEPNKGLAAMFTMMNYERLGVGIQGLGVAERSYQSAIEYARERLQSRAPTGAQQPDKAADPIIVHRVMNFDNAIGYIVDEPNKGLAAMFTMMNYERLGVGIQGLGVAERSYQSAIEYARERLQSRVPTGAQQPDKAADPIIVHPDVRRMLLTMKAMNEGGRAFSTYVAKQLDLAKFSDDTAVQQQAGELVALLTPVAKAFMTDVALETTLHGQMVFGGHGYIREWGQEQLVRDCRITQIYEGTNGIQSLDLAGRKLVANGGAFYQHFSKEVHDFIAANQQLQDFTAPLQKAIENLDELSAWLVEQGKANPNEIGAASVEYLHVFGYTAYAYMWALMAKAAQGREGEEDFYASKMGTARFYFARLLPRIHSLTASVKAGSESLYLLDEKLF
ncbi:acyl-CoA dehydrogenase C-terminal domain-containing protein [Thiopseudomonas denitrificans]|uniref:acyl-CoA dehydrogenase C-terminal domain-containing protein n=1 Tax=Thiopseudomonas denitrificans TaxID=1501432 RepID=UPI001F0B7747|nr:acyl-CoA dehydrogenase C-terminal domain-containing protein [Thiopseudomonas denitrificans]